MANLIQQIKSKFFEKAQVLPPGLYNYHTPKDSDYQYRLHLRIEPDGEGLLIINAHTVLHLNQTAAEYAYHIVNQTPTPVAVESIAKRYQTTYANVIEDYKIFTEKIETLITTPDLEPVTYLELNRTSPYELETMAPYRLDAALTYQLRGESETGITPEERVSRELTFEEWKQILEKAYKVGIPHVIFTGGEPTLRPDLINLIGVAEELGMVSGLATDGVRFAEKEFLEHILNSGLDHLLITLDPEEDQAWEALRDIIPQDLHTTVHLTIEKANEEFYLDIFEKLEKIGVENLSLSYINTDLEPYIIKLRNHAAEIGFNLNWDLPVPYSHYNPVSAELDIEEVVPTGAGKGWLYLEPDGDVLPGQGINNILGNFLNDEFEIIWKKSKEFQKSHE